MNVRVHLIIDVCRGISWEESIILYYNIIYSFGGRKMDLPVHLIYAQEYHGNNL